MKQLSNITQRKVTATERTNVPDVLSPILEFEPDDGIGLIIRGMVATGEADGFPIYADLRDSNGDPLPVDTSLAFQYERPSDDDRTTVTHVQDNIRVFNSLSINEQQNAEHIDQVKQVLKNTEAAQENGETPTLGVRDIDSLYVSVESSTQIDWSNSKLYVAGEAVKTVS